MTKPKTPPHKSSDETSAPDPVRAKLDEATKALAPDDVGKVPAYAEERLKHLADFAVAAARDAAELCAVALPDGNVQAWEIDVLPAALAEAKQLGVAVAADKTASGFTLSAPDAAVLVEVRAAQRKVLRAFRKLRYPGQTARLQHLDAIEAGDPGDVIDAHDDNVKLVALATHKDERTWFASLKTGEPQALALIQRHHDRVEALAKEALKHKGAADRRAELQRVWTVIARVEQRVRAAADYLYDATPKREDYRAFEPPTEKRRKAARRADGVKKRAARKTAKAAKKTAADAARKAAKAAKKT